MATNPGKKQGHGFSLVEMLVVLAVVGLLAGVAVPTLTSVVQGSVLTQSADLLIGEMSTARLRSTAENRSISFRFFRFKDESVPGSEDKVRGFQYGYAADPAATSGGRDEFEPISKFFRFPTGVIAADGRSFSPLADDPELRCGRGEGRRDLPVDVSRCSEFQFRADGSTDLPQGSADGWYLTLVNETDVLAEGGDLPKNIVVIQVDPVTGNFTDYRPN